MGLSLSLSHSLLLEGGRVSLSLSLSLVGGREALSLSLSLSLSSYAAALLDDWT